MIFQALWHINDDNLAIALHHGSLDAASAQGRGRHGRGPAAARSSAPRRSISASTGATSISSSMSARRRAPRGCCSASAAPTTGSTSRRAAFSFRPTASRCWNAALRSGRSPTSAQDTPPLRTGALDVLAQHVLGSRLRRAVRRRRALSRGADRGALRCAHRADFDAVVDFVATGGYALQGLRALRQDQADQGRPLARRQSDGWRNATA